MSTSRKCVLFGLFCCFLLAALIWERNLSSCCAQTQQEAFAPSNPKHVLVLFSYGYSLPAYQKVGSAFALAMESAGFKNSSLFFEYLDLLHVKDKKHLQLLVEMLQHKYAELNVGLIITLHSPAMSFLLNEAKDLFPAVPKMAWNAQEAFKQEDPEHRLLHVLARIDVQGTLERGLELFPQTRKVLFISGVSQTDRQIEEYAKSVFAHWEGELQFELTSSLPVEEMLNRVATLPAQTIVIYWNIFSDITGRTFTPKDVGNMITRVANAPVFCLYDTVLDSGMIGGSLLSFQAEGTRLGMLAGEVLNGGTNLLEQAQQFPSPPVLLFDWQQIQKWGGKPENLPEGCVFLNRPVSIWKQVGQYLVVFIVFSLAQSFLIVSLLLQRRHRRTAEESLQQSEAKYRGIFENAMEGIFQCTPEGSFISVNPACAHILGYESPQELMEKIGRIDQVYPSPEAHMKVMEIIEETGALKDFETRVVRRDGSQAWVSVNTVAMRNSDGEILSYDGTILEVTQRKVAEQELQRHRDYLEQLVCARTIDLENARHRIELLLEAVGDGIYGLDMEGKLTFINPSAAKMIGWEIQEVLGQTQHAVLHHTKPDGSPYPLEECPIYLSFTAGRKHRSSDDLFWRKDGTSFPVEYVSTPVEENGRRLGSVVVFRDITERKKAEAELLRAKEEWEHTFSTVPDLIVILDDEHRVVRANKAMAERLGLTPEKCIGVNCFKAVHGTDEPPDFCPHSRTIADGREHSAEVYEERLGGHFLVSTTPVLNNEGQMLGTVHVARNITERKQAEQSLEEARKAAEAANRSKSDFLAHMSHELRTPLSAIISYAQLMARDRHLTPPQKDHLAAIGRNSDYLLEMINDVLEMSRIEAGGLTVDEDELDIHDLLCTTVNMFAVRANEKGLQLSLETSPQLPGLLRTDSRKLRQILINLLGNAIKFTSQGGVVVRAQYATGQLLLDVEDTGPGIEPGELESIFHSFSQTDLGRSASHGTGLGLTISRSFAQVLGGRIEVHSVIDRGSRFRVEIPAPAAERDSEADKAVPIRPIALEIGQPAYTILVAEDHGDSRDALRGILESVGFTVVVAANGQETLDQYSTQHPHLILMDIRMPIMDGLEAARRIKETEKGRDVKIVALTAHAFEEEKETIWAAGCDDLVRKPFSEVEIFETIKKHLGVRYQYEKQPAPHSICIGDMPEKDALWALPPDVFSRLLEAVTRLDPQGCLRVIGEISALDPVLARGLVNLVDGFRFDLLGDLLERDPHDGNPSR